MSSTESDQGGSTTDAVTAGPFVQSLARGLAVITAFDAEHSAMTLTEVAERADLGSRATARRFLHTLVELGFVRADGRLFHLTPQVLRLGTAYLSGSRLPALAQPHLEKLSAQLRRSTSLAVLDGTEIVYVARVSTRSIMTVDITVGTRLPAFATSMGRVLLAGLTPEGLAAYFAVGQFLPPTPRTLHREVDLRAEFDRVRGQRWAMVDQELEIGLRSLAVPVTGSNGGVVGAINVSSTAGAESPAEFLRRSLDPLRATARAIDKDLIALQFTG